MKNTIKDTIINFLETANNIIQSDKEKNMKNMKNTTKNNIINFLETAQNIIQSDNETEFSEIKKKKRVEIAKLFESTFDCRYDGDSDGCAIFFHTEIGEYDINIDIFSNCQYTTEVTQNPRNMQVIIEEEGTCIEGIVPAIEFLKSLDVHTLPLALLNTAILTHSGNYTLTDISVDEARQLVQDNIDNLDSAVGHQSPAEIMTTLLDVEIPVNRQVFAHEVGQSAIVFKLNGRPEEGKVLSVEEIKQIGFKFQLLTRND